MFKLFLTFLRIGAFTFGGGYAMLPVIESEIVDKAKMLDKEDFVDYISLAQSFPGPISVNISLLLGFRFGGLLGAFSCVMGTVLPSFFSIVVVCKFYDYFKDSFAVQGFFRGVNAVVPALLLTSFISVFSNVPKKPFIILLFAASLVSVAYFKINPIYVIVAGGAIGLCNSLLSFISYSRK